MRIALSPRRIVPGRLEERFAVELDLKLEHGYGLLRNVSASGVYFVTDVALKEGQRVKFTLEFRDFPSGPIAVYCTARVVRVEERGVKKGVAAAISSFEFHRVIPPGKAPSKME